MDRKGQGSLRCVHASTCSRVCVPTCETRSKTKFHSKLLDESPEASLRGSSPILSSPHFVLSTRAHCEDPGEVGAPRWFSNDHQVVQTKFMKNFKLYGKICSKLYGKLHSKALWQNFMAKLYSKKFHGKTL